MVDLRAKPYHLNDEAIAVAYGKLQSGQYAPCGAEKKQEFLRNLGG